MKNILFFLMLLAGHPLFAEPIEDNSILLEEAYNQEPGIYQFMLNYEQTKDNDWTWMFTNEIPVGGQTHQFSYVVPFQHLDSNGKEGVGDVLLNYRYQLMNQGAVALAPRFGVKVPTGNSDDGLGTGGVGFEYNFAGSFKICETFVMHVNAGVNFDPKVKPADVAELETVYGLSGIYHFSDNFDVMLETKGVGEDLYVAPGLRAAFNSGRWQFVPAVEYMHNVKPYADEHSFLAYFSAEGPL